MDRKMQRAIKLAEETNKKFEIFLKLEGAVDTIRLFKDGAIEDLAKLVHYVNDQDKLDREIKVKLIRSIKDMPLDLYNIMEWIIRIELYTKGSISDFLSQEPRTPLPQLQIIRIKDAFCLPGVEGINVTVKRWASDSLERDTYKLVNEFMEKLEELKKFIEINFP